MSNQMGTKCKHCQYWCDACKEINLQHPGQAHLPTESLCWCCKNAVPDKECTRGCDWSIKGKPIDGWEVTEASTFVMSDGRQGRTYKVARCPKFERG